MHFSQFSEENFTNISEKFPRNYVFRPNAQKINAWFVKSFDKYAKMMHFSQFS